MPSAHACNSSCVTQPSSAGAQNGMRADNSASQRLSQVASGWSKLLMSHLPDRLHVLSLLTRSKSPPDLVTPSCAACLTHEMLRKICAASNMADQMPLV